VTENRSIMQEQHVTEQHVTRAIPYEVPYEGDFKKAQITRSFSEETVCAQALVSKRGFPVKASGMLPAVEVLSTVNKKEILFCNRLFWSGPSPFQLKPDKSGFLLRRCSEKYNYKDNKSLIRRQFHFKGS